MILLLVLFSLTGSMARPQDVEFVTSLETLQDETITDNPVTALELGDTRGKTNIQSTFIITTLSMNLN